MVEEQLLDIASFDPALEAKNSDSPSMRDDMSATADTQSAKADRIKTARVDSALHTISNASEPLVGAPTPRDETTALDFDPFAETALHPSQAPSSTTSASVGLPGSTTSRGSAQPSGKNSTRTETASLTQTSRPRLRSFPHVCRDLFSSLPKESHAPTVVVVDVHATGRATLHHILSPSRSSRELAEASELCVSRMQFEPAIDLVGNRTVGSATLRLHWSEG